MEALNFALLASGHKLGKPKNLTREAQAKGVASIKQKAASNHNNRRASAMIGQLRSQGKTFAQIADPLNKDGFVTATGKEFQPNRCSGYTCR